MRRRSAKEQAVFPSHHRLIFDAASVQDGAGISIPSHAAQVFRVAFVMDRKLLAGVNAILRITISKRNGWLMIKSGLVSGCSVIRGTIAALARQTNMIIWTDVISKHRRESG
jgi:hypothetical protein